MPAPHLASFPAAHGRFLRVTLTGLIAGLLLGLAAAPARAQITRVANTTLTLPQTPQTFGYGTEDAFPGITFDQPLCIVTPPGETDRIFVLEKTGRIQVVSGLATTPVKQLFLDLSARVLTNSEQGLLGLAFHPNFATNHFFYVFYSLTATTSAGTGDHERVARFTALAAPATNADLLATEVPLISQFDDAANHNGGDLHFGPDGYLYVSLGDEGGANDQYNNSQRIDKDFFSGILRLDVDQRAGNLVPNTHPSVHPGTYRIPADNPFIGATTFNGAAVSPASVRTEFWAVGLRNPWRFSFDYPTARLLAGDVGQSAREEIDLITRGGNYGWNYREGTIAGPRANPPAAAVFTDPIWDTPDRTLAGSITGGVVYRGSRFAQLYGQYVFGDYLQSHIFAMTFPASGPVQVQKIADESNPVAFGADPRNGDILIACIGTGHIRRLVYNSTPTGTPLPATLTATGAFSDLTTLAPAAGVVAYDPNISFWSDYAKKRRWFSVPALTDKITFAAEGNWTFPAGTVWVKHFDLELTRGDPATARRLETRFIVKTAAGVYGVTYRWNMAQTEATLVPEAGADEVITINDGGTPHLQTWHYPSRSECLECHTPVAGQALSFNTAQLNLSRTYGSGAANQLTALANAGYFTAAIPAPATLRALAPATDATATLELRVRSYLAANCVQCHQPGGAALGNWDARLATPTTGAGLINGLLVDNGGNSANRVLVPKDPAHSMMLTRLGTRGLNQMPPIASNELDTADINLVTAWVNALGAPAVTAPPAGQPAAAGSSVTLAVTATNSLDPVSYQWRRNGVNIAGATSSTLNLANLDFANAGVYDAVLTNPLGATTSAGAILTVTVSTGDFRGDGKAEPAWHNTATGLAGAWFADGTFIPFGTESGGWVMLGSGDFDGDGKADPLWHNTSTGLVASWASGGGFINFGTEGSGWAVIGTGDFDGDGKADILWHNTATGLVATWASSAGFSPLGVESAGWTVIGTGDFDFDGKADVLWHNASTGLVAAWNSGGSYTTFGTEGGGWAVIGTGDFDGDGKADVLWRHPATGLVAAWTSSGGFTNFGTEGGGWQVIGTGDFNGDGKADVLWLNLTTGVVSAGLANGTFLSLGVQGGGWSITN